MSWRKQIAGVQLGYDVLTDDQREFWYAPSSGPLHAAWKDKPTRLLYDLIRIWLAKDAEIERLKAEVRSANERALRIGTLLPTAHEERTQLRAALRETREALRKVHTVLFDDLTAVERSEIQAVLARHAPLAGERTCCDCHGTGTVVSYEVGSGGDVVVEPCRCAGEEKSNV